MKREPSPSSSASFATPTKAAPNASAIEHTLPLSDLSLFVATELNQDVVYRGRKYMLTSIADYSLGYDEAGTMLENLIVVEAKQTCQIPVAYGQLLSYMGKHRFLNF